MTGKNFGEMATELFDKYRIPTKALVPDIILSTYNKRCMFSLIKFCDYLEQKFGKEYADKHSYREMAEKIFGNDTDKIMSEYFMIDNTKGEQI